MTTAEDADKRWGIRDKGYERFKKFSGQPLVSWKEAKSSSECERIA